MLTRARFAIALLLSLSVAACGGESLKRALDGPACEIGSLMVETRLFFGLGRKDAPPVSEAEWQDFLDKEVTPRFEEGLTVLDADGQYLGMDGTLIQEESRVLILIYNGNEARSRDIEAIRDAYKARFDQESVLRIDQPICADF